MADDHLNALPKGCRIQEYEIVRVLGAGGFGITYLAYDHNLDSPVAIKEYFYAGVASRQLAGAVVPSSRSNADSFQWGYDRFVEEARLLSRLDHPNIVGIHRYFTANSTAYVVMDYVEGESLAAVLENHNTLTPAQWRPWMNELLDGLEHVHQHNYLHRDIKPANIVIRAVSDGRTRPILVDFGAARRSAAEKTRHLTAVHTHGYAPIEQYSSFTRQGPATDIYALAAVSYRVLTGEVPPAAPERMLDDDFIPLAKLIGWVDRTWLAGIDSGLAARPDKRPQTIAAWRTALAHTEKPSTPTGNSRHEDTKERASFPANDPSESRSTNSNHWTAPSSGSSRPSPLSFVTQSIADSGDLMRREISRRRDD